MKLINLKTLCEMLGGRSRTSVYRDIAQGKLPKPIKTGANSSRWVASEIEACVRSMMEGRHV